MSDRGKRRSASARPPRSPGGPPLYAAVDLGTNNCRLMIAEARGDGFKPVDTHSQIVRLGEGLASDGRICDAAIDRGMNALGVIRDKLKAKSVRRIRCVATQACRAASNGREFIHRVQNELGLTFKVITPAEEARLAVIGCHNLFDDAADIALVVDIGGGSTELSWVNVEKIRNRPLSDLVREVPVLNWASFPVGVVTLTEAFLHLDEADRYAAMRAHTLELLQGFDLGPAMRRRMERGQAHLLGTSGTVTSLAAVHLGLDRYVRSRVDGCWMARSEAVEITRKLEAAGMVGRSKIGCIGADRAELIMAGCAILDAVFECWPSERIRVADRGLREGVLLSMIHKSRGASGARKRKPRRGGRSGSANTNDG